MNEVLSDAQLRFIQDADEVRRAYSTLRDQHVIELDRVQRKLEAIAKELAAYKTSDLDVPILNIPVDSRAAPIRIAEYGDRMFGMGCMITPIDNGYIIRRGGANDGICFYADSVSVKQAMSYAIDMFDAFVAAERMT